MWRGDVGCCASAALLSPNDPKQAAREMRGSRRRRRVNLSPCRCTTGSVAGWYASRLRIARRMTVRHWAIAPVVRSDERQLFGMLDGPPRVDTRHSRFCARVPVRTSASIEIHSCGCARSMHACGRAAAYPRRIDANRIPLACPASRLPFVTASSQD